MHETNELLSLDGASRKRRERIFASIQISFRIVKICFPKSVLKRRRKKVTTCSESCRRNIFETVPMHI
jgi:hypothetical protein